MTPGERRKRFERMVSRLRAGAQVLEDLALEVESLLEEHATPGQQAKEFLDWWCARWAEVHGARYVVNGAKDMALIKRALSKVPLADLERRAVRYLRDQDRYVRDAKRPLGLFITRVNRYAEHTATVDGDLPIAPVDCRHDPPCGSDVEHTRRVMAEARA